MPRTLPVPSRYLDNMAITVPETADPTHPLFLWAPAQGEDDARVNLWDVLDAMARDPELRGCLEKVLLETPPPV